MIKFTGCQNVASKIRIFTNVNSFELGAFYSTVFFIKISHTPYRVNAGEIDHVGETVSVYPNILSRCYFYRSPQMDSKNIFLDGDLKN
jgi:hypothetical protein